MNESGISHPLPKIDCPDCKKPMRVLNFAPLSKGMRDLTYQCDACGTITGAVYKSEEKPPPLGSLNT